MCRPLDPRSCIERRESIEERPLDIERVGGERVRWAGAGVCGIARGSGVGLYSRSRSSL